MSETSKQTKSWRDVLPIHPAAELFPLMSEAELKELADDIIKNGQIEPIIYWQEDGESVLDGRNRLDAMALAGLLGVNDEGRLYNVRSGGPIYGYCYSYNGGDFDRDPYALALSLNVRRRHLTVEQKRDLIIKVLKATPEKSNRQIAETVKASHVTVGTVRAELESTGQIDQLKKTVGKDGKAREQPARHSGTRHKCWQCGVCALVGEVRQHEYAAYYDADVWLHNSCVAAFEAGEAARAHEAAATREAEAATPIAQATSGTPETPINTGIKTRVADDLPARAMTAPKAEIEVDPAISAEKRKAEYGAAVNARDSALLEDSHILRLLQMITKAKPERFAKTGVSAVNLMYLGRFLTALAEAARP